MAEEVLVTVHRFPLGTLRGKMVQVTGGAGYQCRPPNAPSSFVGAVAYYTSDNGTAETLVGTLDSSADGEAGSETIFTPRVP